MKVRRTILHRTVGRMLAIIAGIVLILIGIAGLFLPFLPGTPLIASGIILVWPKTRLAIWLKHLMARIRERVRERRSWLGQGQQTNVGDRLAARDPTRVPNTAPTRQGDHDGVGKAVRRPIPAS